ncbi:MAG: TRC40/GET3/ArsA family transport-energizing ATPase [Candidatus Omnitrophica bacterium]|nr:TRC40/GET3/ArsA family transport-energizing ATPase [Candidatus Omnitrophota bacterium]
MTRFYFFSGKGGVGKTTMAAASAVYFASQSKKTLIITTDPASNLADVFEQKIGHKIVQINGVPNLFAVELDPDIATTEYKEKTLAPLRGLIPEESFKVLEEQLNSPCTAEMAAFDRFTDFLQNSEYEVVIFDTAPTGHTLRLLELPVEWSKVIEKAAKEEGGGQTCIGPAAALAESKTKFDRAISAMQDTSRTTFVFVLRPELTPIYEAERSMSELLKLKITSQELIINGIYPQNACNNPFMLARFAKQQKFLEFIKNKFTIPITLMELEPQEIKGKDLLLKIGEKLHTQAKKLSIYQPITINVNKKDLGELTLNNFPRIDKKIKRLLIPHNGKRRTVFFAGKGGVGKTSVAAATSLWIAEQGYKTLLLTTDPASHLSQIFEQDISDNPTLVAGEKNLWAARIDAEKATSEYKEKILAEVRKKYNEQRVEAIEEELNSPCTEEMATFEKFIDFATQKDFEVIVFDTAPTGHTLRLLELPVNWSKQIEIKTFTTSGETEVDKITKSRFKEIIDMMQDTNQTTFSFVMYPESTPIKEAARAMEELLTIGVPTSLVVANFILPESIITNDYWRQRKAMEGKYLGEMHRRFTAPIVRLPLLVDDLIGKEKLKQAGYLLYGKLVCAENASRFQISRSSIIKPKKKILNG